MVLSRFAFARLTSCTLGVASLIAVLLLSAFQTLAADKSTKKSDRPLKYGSVLLFEPATGKILYHHNADRLTYPASLTKLMTAYLTFEAIKQGKLTLESNLIISDHARAQPATRVGMKKGIDVSIDFAVRALIIRSANDFALALAETVSGSETKFVDRMNATARRLGMSRTNFTNPHGLPNANQVSTARDLALLTSAVLRDFPQYGDMFSNEEVKFRTLTLRSHNSLLRTFEGADGMKTGFTCASGYNIIASATRNNRRLAVVVVGALTGYERVTQATSRLREGFESFARTEKSEPGGNVSLASLPLKQLKDYDTLDLSHKTRTWVCGNSPKPRKARKRRKKKKSARKRSKKKKSKKSTKKGKKK